MLRFNRDVFDEFISGTTGTWYTSAADNAVLGSADSHTIFAVTTNIGGVFPALNVYVDTSCDNQTWVLGASPVISSWMTLGPVFHASGVAAPFVRLRVTLGGTAPQCRLKLSVCGRD